MFLWLNILSFGITMQHGKVELWILLKRHNYRVTRARRSRCCVYRRFHLTQNTTPSLLTSRRVSGQEAENQLKITEEDSTTSSDASDAPEQVWKFVQKQALCPSLREWRRSARNAAINEPILFR